MKMRIIQSISLLLMTWWVTTQQGARSSAAMVLTKFAWIIPEGLNHSMTANLLINDPLSLRNIVVISNIYKFKYFSIIEIKNNSTENSPRCAPEHLIHHRSTFVRIMKKKMFTLWLGIIRTAPSQHGQFSSKYSKDTHSLPRSAMYWQSILNLKSHLWSHFFPRTALHTMFFVRCYKRDSIISYRILLTAIVFIKLYE